MFCLFSFFLYGICSDHLWSEESLSIELQSLPSPTLPLLMSTEMEIIIASNVSLLDSKIVHMEMIGLFYNSCYRSFAKSDRCHCFIHMLCFQGFLLFSTFRSKQWVQRETNKDSNCFG